MKIVDKLGIKKKIKIYLYIIIYLFYQTNNTTNKGQPLITNYFLSTFLSQPSSISMSPDNEYIALSNLGGNFISIFKKIEINNQEVLAPINNYYSKYFNNVSSVAFAPYYQTNGSNKTYFIAASNLSTTLYNSQIVLFSFNGSNELTPIYFFNGLSDQLNPIYISFSPNLGTSQNPIYFLAISYIGSVEITLLYYDITNQSLSFFDNAIITTNANIPGNVDTSSSFSSSSFSPTIFTINNNKYVGLVTTNYKLSQLNSYIIDNSGSPMKSSEISINLNSSSTTINPINTTIINNNVNDDIYVSCQKTNTINNTISFIIKHYTGSYTVQNNQIQYLITYQGDITIPNTAVFPFISIDPNYNIYAANFQYIPTRQSLNKLQFFINKFNIQQTVSSGVSYVIYDSPAIFGTSALAFNNNYIYVASSNQPFSQTNQNFSISIFKLNNNKNNPFEYIETFFDSRLKNPSSLVANNNYLFVSNLYPNDNGYYYINIYTINTDGTIVYNNQYIDKTSNNQYLNRPTSLAISNDGKYLFVGNQGNSGSSFISVFDIEDLINGNGPSAYVYSPENIDILNNPVSMSSIPALLSPGNITNALLVANLNNHSLSIFFYSGDLKSTSNPFNIVYTEINNAIRNAYDSLFFSLNSLTSLIVSNFKYQYLLGSNLNNSLTFVVLYEDNICSVNDFILNFYLQSPNSVLLLNNVNYNNLNIIASNSNNSLVLFNLENSNNCSILNTQAGENAISIDPNNILPSTGVSDVSFKTDIGNVTYNNNQILYYPQNSPNIFSGLNTITYEFLYNNQQLLKPLEYFIAGIYIISISPIAYNDTINIYKNSNLIINLNNLVLGSNYNVTYTQPSNGSLYYDNINNKFFYIPNNNFIGTDSFTYTITTQSSQSGSSLTPPSNTGEIIISVNSIIENIKQSILSKDIKNKYKNRCNK